MEKLDLHPKKSFYLRLRARILNSVPARHELACSRWLRPVAHRLVHDDLWRFKRDAVARGVAIGLFWAFILPVAQILASVFQCVFHRGMISAAIISTFITNPLNFPLWWWLAFQVGNFILGGDLAYSPPPDSAQWLGWALSIGKPTFLGMFLFAIFFSSFGYFAVKLVWNFRVMQKRKNRRLSYRLASKAGKTSATTF